MKKIGTGILLLASVAALAGQFVAPHASYDQFRDFPYAPPMRPRIVAPDGSWHLPFVHPLRLTDRLARRYEEDKTQRVSLRWVSQGLLVRSADENATPLLLLGTDGLGRDVLARLVHGSRLSLGVALIAAAGALIIGVVVGGVAGYAGGTFDDLLMRLVEFVLVLPSIYVVLALRAALPLVLPTDKVFFLVAGLLALIGWPSTAMGVRAIVSTERRREYATAAKSLGAGHVRILLRHLLPAARGFVTTQVVLLLPAFIMAEATLSFVGLGFAEPTPSWGTMLREAVDIRALAEFPWLLSPAAAIVSVVFGVNVLIPEHSWPNVPNIRPRFEPAVDTPARAR